MDLLVVMPAGYELGQAFKIRLALPAPFAMDLLVRTPKNLHRLLDEGESFTTEIMTEGKVLYEKGYFINLASESLASTVNLAPAHPWPGGLASPWLRRSQLVPALPPRG